MLRNSEWTTNMPRLPWSSSATDTLYQDRINKAFGGPDCIQHWNHGAGNALNPIEFSLPSWKDDVDDNADVVTAATVSDYVISVLDNFEYSLRKNDLDAGQWRL